MKTLIIGGAGYIGSHVVLELLDQGDQVTVFDNLSTGSRKNVPDAVRFIKGDILDEQKLQAVFESDHFDAVFHFAALKAAGDSMTDPGSFAKQNISGSINVLNAMVDNSVNKIIFSSSAAVYGYPKYNPIDENHPANPINFYGFTKLEIERLLHWYSELKEIRFAALRYFNAAGYDPKGRITEREYNCANLLPIVMETAAGIRDKVLVFGDDYDTSRRSGTRTMIERVNPEYVAKSYSGGNQLTTQGRDLRHDSTGVRDYIHVTDLATAHIKAMNYLNTENKDLTINLGTGQGYSVLEVINMAKKVSGKNILYEITDRRPGDPAELIATSNIANQLLDWEPEYSELEIILESMWNVYGSILSIG